MTRILAHNGSLLAHAHRDPPSIRSARTESATLSSAYTSYNNAHGRTIRPQSPSGPDEASGFVHAASIIYESRTSNHITILSPVTSKILLAVTGFLSREVPAPQEQGDGDDVSDIASSASTPPERPLPHDSKTNGLSEAPKPLPRELESLSEHLWSTLKEEMGQMRWPEGA